MGHVHEIHNAVLVQVPGQVAPCTTLVVFDSDDDVPDVKAGVIAVEAANGVSDDRYVRAFDVCVVNSDDADGARRAPVGWPEQEFDALGRTGAASTIVVRRP